MKPALPARKVVGSKWFTKLGFLLEAIQIVTHSLPVWESFTACRSILLAVKALRLLEQEEGIAMGSTARDFACVID
jgi:hypothetical protein